MMLSSWACTAVVVAKHINIEVGRLSVVRSSGIESRNGVDEVQAVVNSSTFSVEDTGSSQIIVGKLFDLCRKS